VGIDKGFMLWYVWLDTPRRGARLQFRVAPFSSPSRDTPARHSQLKPKGIQERERGRTATAPPSLP